MKHQDELEIEGYANVTYRELVCKWLVRNADLVLYAVAIGVIIWVVWR